MSTLRSFDPFYIADTLRTGQGLYTRRPFGRGDLVFTMTGERRFYESRTVADAFKYENWIGIEKDTFLDPSPPYVFGNHSCEPNLGIQGAMDFIALRDIDAGEELTYDYSITSDERPWTMTCACDTQNCRKVIRSIQFFPEEAYRRYLPYVGTYFQALYRGVKAP